MKLSDLAKAFPRDAVHWRAQTLTRNGDKALALAYLDARDVMDRLDEVCGPEKWQSRYFETAKGRVICEIGIRVGDEWVWKSDGAGDTAVEGEKGGISDALKRAAVQWGIGRYLYRLDAVWAPCEVREANGKRHWKAWKGSPWDHVRARPEPPLQNDFGRASDAISRVTPDQAVMLADLEKRAGSDRAAIFTKLKIDGDTWADLPASLFEKIRDGMAEKIAKMEAEKEAQHDDAVRQQDDLGGDSLPY